MKMQRCICLLVDRFIQLSSRSAIVKDEFVVFIIMVANTYFIYLWN